MWSDWLVFCDCGFQSLCPLMEKDKSLMESSWWERLTVGETRVLFSWAGPCSVNLESNFLSMGRVVFPPCCLTWDQTMVEIMKTYLNGLLVFPTLFNFSLNLAIRSSWSEPQSAPGIFFADCIELLYLWLQRIWSIWFQCLPFGDVHV